MDPNPSPAPGTPQSGTKAYLATALTVLTVFASIWISDDDPFTKKEVVQALITGLISGGVVGVPTYAVRNRAK